MATPFEKQLSLFLDSTKCKGEMDSYQSCLTAANTQKKQLKCKEFYRKYMFCLTSLEEARLKRDEIVEQFKDKWGHYPTDSE
jgi:hypothetical protein